MAYNPRVFARAPRAKNREQSGKGALMSAAKHRKQKPPPLPRGKPQEAERRPGFPYRAIFLLAAVLLITVLVYSPSFKNGFVNWDDDVNVYENPYIRAVDFENLKVYFTRPLLGMYTPLVYLSYALDYALAGLNPARYHATNLLLHLLNVFWVFLIVKRLTFRAGAGLIAALLFALHPMNVDAVAHVSVRSGLLSSSFYCAAFFGYLLYLRSSRQGHFWGAFLLFCLALLSKASAVTLPLILLLTDIFLGRNLGARALLEKIPFLLGSAVLGLLTFILREDVSQGLTQGYSFLDRIFLGTYSLAFYVIKFFAPLNLSAYYPYPLKNGGALPVEYYLSPLLIFLAAGAVYRARSFRRELIYAFLFYLIQIALVIKIIPLGADFVAERYAYLAYIGFFLVAGKLFCRAWDRAGEGMRRLLIAGGVLVLAGVFSLSSFMRNEVWQDSLTLWNDALSKHPEAALAYNNRGQARASAKDYARAMKDFDRAIELHPAYGIAYHNRGLVQADAKDFSGAIRDYDQAVRFSPRYAPAFFNRGIAKAALGDLRGGAEDFGSAVQINPDYAEAYVNRALARKDLGARKEALEDLDQAIRMRPDYDKAYFGRALLKAEAGDFKGAVQDYSKVIQMTPGMAIAYNNRGSARGALNDYEAAIEDYGRAVRIDPGYARAWFNRANAKLALKQFAGAAKDYDRAIELKPDYAAAYFNRGLASLELEQVREACRDWQAASQLGHPEARSHLDEHCRSLRSASPPSGGFAPSLLPQHKLFR